MAFVQVETWPADAFQRIGTAPRSPKIWPWSGLLANGRDTKTRRMAAVALSLAIHAGAIWLTLDRLATGIGEGEGQGRADGIVMIDLSGMQSADSAPSPASVASPPPVPTLATSTVEASAPSDKFKPEWTVSKLRIATQRSANLAPAPPAVPGSVMGQTGSIGAGAGGGGQGYDPYAGASPQRRDLNVAMATGDAKQAPGLDARVMGWLGTGSGSDAPVLNQRAFEEATSAVRQALPRVRGRLEINVRISSAGVVLDAQIRNATLGVENARRARSVLIGRKLFDAYGSINDVHWIKLPTTILT